MPADPAAAQPEPKRVTLATDLIPLGERALRGILDHVVAVGDEAETTHLEVKSSLDLSSKAGVAKVAKFLLGSANRRPNEAARHFHGYAVLVIGAAALHARDGTIEDELMAALERWEALSSR